MTMATTLSTPAPQTHSRPLRHAWSDTATMVRRQFVHAARYPVWIFLVVAPVAILLLAVFVFVVAILEKNELVMQQVPQPFGVEWPS